MIAEPSLDAPDEDWVVWADAMRQLGDPRGELVALAHHPGQLAKSDQGFRRTRLPAEITPCFFGDIAIGSRSVVPHRKHAPFSTTSWTQWPHRVHTPSRRSTCEHVGSP